MIRWLKRSLSSSGKSQDHKDKEPVTPDSKAEATLDSDKDLKNSRRNKSKKGRKIKSEGKIVVRSKDGIEIGQNKEKRKAIKPVRRHRGRRRKPGKGSNNRQRTNLSANEGTNEAEQPSEKEPSEDEVDSMTDELDEDAEEGDDFVGEFVFDDKEASAEEDNDFACLSPEEIIKEQQKMIKEVAELLNVPESTSANLLRHYAWKKEVLFIQYFDDPQAVLTQTGSKPGSFSKKNVKVGDGSLIKLSGIGACLICGDSKEAKECTAITCRHRFCNECFATFLTMKINERQVTKLACPAANCNLFVGDDVVKKLVTEEIYKKYYSFITQSFVEDNRQVTWCPYPNCGHAITTDMVSGRVVSCKCGYRFCFTCHHEAHAPANCEQVKDWQKKCQDDSETVHWIGANTKDCPRCSVPVEKNGGCNHMTCRNCGYEWCWLCLRPWKGHNDYYTCNRFEKTQKKKEKKKKKG